MDPIHQKSAHQNRTVRACFGVVKLVKTPTQLFWFRAQIFYAKHYGLNLFAVQTKYGVISLKFKNRNVRHFTAFHRHISNAPSFKNMLKQDVANGNLRLVKNSLPDNEFKLNIVFIIFVKIKNAVCKQTQNQMYYNIFRFNRQTRRKSYLKISKVYINVLRKSYHFRANFASNMVSYFKMLFRAVVKPFICLGYIKI